MTQAVVNIIDLCVRRWRFTILVGALLLVACAFYAATRFSINTDIQTLVAQNLPWHQRQVELSKAFPQKGISVVVTATTPENADVATDALAQWLKQDSELFRDVVEPDSGARRAQVRCAVSAGRGRDGDWFFRFLADRLSRSIRARIDCRLRYADW